MSIRQCELQVDVCAAASSGPLKTMSLHDSMKTSHDDDGESGGTRARDVDVAHARVRECRSAPKIRQRQSQAANAVDYEAGIQCQRKLIFEWNCNCCLFSLCAASLLGEAYRARSMQLLPWRHAWSAARAERLELRYGPAARHRPTHSYA